MNHDCNETEPLLSGYLDGELTQGDRQRVELILEDCAECARVFDEMKNSASMWAASPTRP